MAQQLEWGSPESDGIINEHASQLLAGGVYTVYLTYFSELKKAGYGRYVNALRSELPLVGRIAGEEYASSLMDAKLELCKVDTETGVRLDRTSLRVATVERSRTYTAWRIGRILGHHYLDDEQAQLVLDQATELLSHGLEIR
jgi:hypothetical protein